MYHPTMFGKHAIGLFFMQKMFRKLTSRDGGTSSPWKKNKETAVEFITESGKSWEWQDILDLRETAG
jgi:hypothetical protein